MSKRIIVIGGTAAGMTFASKLSRYKEKIDHVVYEKRPYISLGACGIPFYIGGHAKSEEQLLALKNDEAIERGINVKANHEVISVDTTTKTVEVRNLQTNDKFIDNYDELFIGTGAHPFIPNLPGINLKNVCTSTTLEDAKSLRKLAEDSTVKKIAIIGSGFIGMEVAENLIKYNKEIRFIETADSLSSKAFDAEFTKLLEQEVLKHKIQINLKETLLEIKGTSKPTSVVTNKGEYEVDAVIVAVGFSPSTELFTGQLDMYENGSIKINRKGQTSKLNVWAAGDSVSVYDPVIDKDQYYPLATTSRKMATIVYENMIEKNDKEYIGSTGTSGFRFQDIELFTTGITESNAKKMNMKTNSVFIKGKDSASYAGESTELCLKMIANDDGVIVGAQALGTNRAAAMRIMALTVAITNKMVVEDIENLDLFYAPPFSSATDIIHIAARILNKKVRK